MKYFFALISILFYWVCNSQEKFSIFEDNYKFSISQFESYSIIEGKRNVDQLQFKFKVIPKLDDLLNSFLFKIDNELITMNIVLNNKNYCVESIFFNHSDKRISVLNRFTQNSFGIDLSKFKFEKIECENCEENMLFIIYISK